MIGYVTRQYHLYTVLRCVLFALCIKQASYMVQGKKYTQGKQLDMIFTIIYFNTVRDN